MCLYEMLLDEKLFQRFKQGIRDVLFLLKS